MFEEIRQMNYLEKRREYNRLVLKSVRKCLFLLDLKEWWFVYEKQKQDRAQLKHILRKSLNM
jgi:hypothetical protein